MRKIVIAIIAFFIFGVGSAHSNCNQCFSSMNDLERRKGEFLWNYKGTAATLFLCVKGCEGQPRNDQVGCFFAACGISCLAIGFQNCVEFFTTVFPMMEEEQRICTYCRHHGCQVSTCN